MLDIHTHILSGMDDGSRDPAQSVAMLQCEAAQGIRAAALTPHYHASRESPQEFTDRRARAEKLLREALQGRRDVPNVLMGAEVAYFDGMCRCEDVDLLCIGNTRAMLIELPMRKWNQRILSELHELQQIRGIQPVVAHVERYMSYQDHGLIEELARSGMLIQVNASFFLRWQTAWKAMAMLKKQSIHFIASDCHDMERRPPNVGAAVQRIEARLGNQAMTFLKEKADALLGG